MNKLSVALLLILLLAIVYFNAMGNPFHYDDFHHVVTNQNIWDIKNIPTFFVDARTFSKDSVSGHYRPLLMTTHAINYAVGGGNTVGYHIVNLVFHMGSAFMLFLIVQDMLGSRVETQSQETLHPRPFFIALASALIFAVHPFNSEVVNYISTRSSVMSGFFYLLAFYFWVKYRTPPPSPPHRGGRVREGVGFYLASLFAFFLGMLTKEVVITLPVVLWLYDRCFAPELDMKKGGARLTVLVRGFFAYLPFLFLVVVPYLLFRAYLVGGILTSPENRPPRDYYTNILTQTKVLSKYLQLLTLPVGLSVEHYIAEAYSLLNWEVITSALLLIIILSTGILVYYRRSILWRMVSFFIFWFFLVLAPTTIIPLESILQENRGYLAAISFAVISAILLSRISSLKFSGNRYLLLPYSITIFLLVLFLAAYAAGTIRRNTTWKDDITLWSDAVRKEPLSGRAHANLGMSYAEKKEIGYAIVEYQKAIELAPNIKYSHYALGSIYSKLNLFELAIYEYNKTVELDQWYYRAWNNIGMTYWKMGELDKAIDNFKRALAINPDYVLPYFNIGRIYEQQGRIDEAYRELEIANEKALSIPGEKRNAEYAIEYMKQFKMKYK